MKFFESSLAGAFVVEPECFVDERGSFGHVFDRERFEERGLEGVWSHVSVSTNHHKGTLRGMHYQLAPHDETKLVRCSAGAIYDVMLDLRPGSATFGRWHAAELSAANRRMLYIPKGLAHGFQTLQPDSEVTYLISAPYRPDAARGVRWDDPRFAIEWPLEVSRISERDRGFADFRA